LDNWEELFQALVLGIRDYFYKQGFRKACVGLSGGIDSALVLTLAEKALGKENLLAILMPSPFSSEESVSDALLLANRLEVPTTTIAIDPAYSLFLKMLAPTFGNLPLDVTEENIQARIRGLLLMAISNKQGSILLSTGNKSEMAMGYPTLYGDLAGGLAVISDLSKEKVYSLARYINSKQSIIPESILIKEPSAELRPNQKDSDSLPPYPIIDKVLEGYVERNLSEEAIIQEYNLDSTTVRWIIQKIHQSEYKRRQAPPGLRVTKKAFSVGRKFPIVQKWR
jgi:NAD+ synthase (glutamine-hydrolysing)